jgi:hypothetical protein
MRPWIGSRAMMLCWGVATAHHADRETRAARNAHLMNARFFSGQEFLYVSLYLTGGNSRFAVLARYSELFDLSFCL